MIKSTLHNARICDTERSDFRHFLENFAPDTKLDGACEWFRERGNLSMIGDLRTEDVDLWLQCDFDPRDPDHVEIVKTLRGIEPWKIYEKDELIAAAKLAHVDSMYKAMREIQTVAHAFSRVNWHKLRKAEIVRRAEEASAALKALAEKFKAEGRQHDPNP